MPVDKLYETEKYVWLIMAAAIKKSDRQDGYTATVLALLSLCYIP